MPIQQNLLLFPTRCDAIDSAAIANTSIIAANGPKFLGASISITPLGDCTYIFLLSSEFTEEIQSPLGIIAHTITNPLLPPVSDSLAARFN
jgi:hypothetical protein